jgi:hypothetical protein
MQTHPGSSSSAEGTRCPGPPATSRRGYSWKMCSARPRCNHLEQGVWGDEEGRNLFLILGRLLKMQADE